MTDMNETNLSHALPGQERYVAPLEETPLKDVDSVDESAPASSLWADAWRTLRKNPMFIISAVLIVFIIFVALFPGVMTKQNPNYCTLENSLEPASKGHPFGFDLQGCDVYSRVVHGTRTSLSVGVFATVLVVLLGTLIGALSGFFGGWVDIVLQRITEIVACLPFLPMAMILTSIIGNSMTESARIALIMVILGILSWPSLARLVRAQVLAEREQEFVTAANAMGVKRSVIVFKHIIPNVISVIIVSATLDFAYCMLTESTLSFLGFGVKLPRPTWGNMLNGCVSSVVIQNYWWRWVFPAIMLGICVICINMVGDGLRDAIDPKSNER